MLTGFERIGALASGELQNMNVCSWRRRLLMLLEVGMERHCGRWEEYSYGMADMEVYFERGLTCLYAGGEEPVGRSHR